MLAECHFATLWEAFADAVGDEPAVTQGTRTVTWSDYERRAARLAAVLRDGGIGVGSKVALYLHNAPEYLEAQFAALKIRAVPVNVNYRYLDAELSYLLDNSDAEAVVFHASLAEQVAGVMHRHPAVRLWLQVDDVEAAPIPGAMPYEQAIGAAAPAPRQVRDERDVYMLYTGGTTGMPKGVMFPVGEFTRRWVNSIAELLEQPPPPDLGWCVETARQLAAVRSAPVVLPACPLMHGTGMWLGVFMTHSIGAHVVLAPSGSFDPDEIWATVSAHAVTALVIVGDAFALPLIRARETAGAAGPERDVSSLAFVMSSGAMLSAPVKAALIDVLGDSVVIGDMMGSTEGPGGSAVTTKNDATDTARFVPAPGARVLTEHGVDVRAGSGVPGLLAITGPGNVPIGYYKDPERSARLIRTVDGVRYSIPGDWATVDADGTIVLLGRGSGCINTAGEKVFPEEVEEALKQHPSVEDCIVVGLPDERFGERVAAAVAAAPGADLDPEEVQAWAKARLAGYKAPRVVLILPSVPRAANGKADLRAVRTLLLEAEAHERARGRAAPRPMTTLAACADEENL
ncbi:putative fatty-acid-CoA ligase FadD [Dactylosporangium sucinum]|uniref:Fatty-acid-CoA ligase FadD n=1 Tax=Dactylosporangium sucinum TaxID=1424081 RepID=A0A917X5R0_9ACTN|nr:putative fatty-acid-CoA ligase FadD [Dactylosporangium sucinum]